MNGANTKDQSFYQWLQNIPLTEKGCIQHNRNTLYFKRWCASENIIDPDQLSYSELLSYVKYLKEKGINIHTLNIYLNSLKKYYSYCIEKEIREDNPAKTLRVKGSVKTVRKNLLSKEELENLLQQYIQRNDFINPLDRIPHQRNCIILGLMIHQGMHSGEIIKLEVKDLNLRQGTIYVPSSGDANSRTLDLHASQMIALNSYLTHYRSLLGPKDNELIPGRVHTQVSHMFKWIQKDHPTVKNGRQIRASVIMDWVKKYPIREVQHRCGHKKISTTEGYKEEDLEGLQNALGRFHPMG